MSKERADLGFGEALDDLDLSGFAPKPAKAANDRPSKAATAKAAEVSGFKSREPKATRQEPRQAAGSLAEAVAPGQGVKIAPAPAEALQ